MILIVAQCPTPQHTVVYNHLSAEFDGMLHVCYLSSEPQQSRGWGDVRITHRRSVLDRPSAWADFLAILWSPRLRAVCIYGYRGGARVLAANVARMRGLPLTLRGDANIRMELQHGRLRRAAKRAYLRCILGQPEVWTNGSANTAYWSAVGLRRMFYIPYALAELPAGEEHAEQLRRLLGIDNQVVFAYVGRLATVKGIDELMRAYDVVRTKLPQSSVMLVIAGSGPREPDVRRYADSRGDCVYLGSVPHSRLGAVYAAAHVVVVPSHEEAWGWVVNEARGHGARIIASDEVAAADDLGDADTCTRCRAGDPDSLAAAMLREVDRGTSRTERLACVDTAVAMARRLSELMKAGRA